MVFNHFPDALRPFFFPTCFNMGRRKVFLECKVYEAILVIATSMSNPARFLQSQERSQQDLQDHSDYPDIFQYQQYVESKK
jgi:hypothetical protein